MGLITMTMNVRIEQVCAPAYPNPPRIKIQAQERVEDVIMDGVHNERWVDSGYAIYLTGPFSLSDCLMLHTHRRYIISEVM